MRNQVRKASLTVHHSLVTLFVFLRAPALRHCCTRSLDVDWFNKIHVVVLTESDNFEPKEPTNNAATVDKWEGEDEEEDVKVRFTRRIPAGDGSRTRHY